MATEIDIEQSTQIAALTKDIELLRAEVAKYKDKEHQQFNNRINKLEKWVWGCSAVVAAVVTVGGILPKFINFGGGWVGERVGLNAYQRTHVKFM